MIRFLQTPTPAKRFVLGFILVAFCLIMVISLVPNLNQSLLGGAPNANVVAKVGDQEITERYGGEVPDGLVDPEAPCELVVVDTAGAVEFLQEAPGVTGSAHQYR